MVFPVWGSTDFSIGTNTILYVCCGISGLKVHRFLDRNKHHTARLLWYFWSEGPHIFRDEEQTPYYTSAVLFVVWRSTYFSGWGTNTIQHVCCAIYGLKDHRFLGMRNKHHTTRLLCYFWSEGPHISRHEEQTPYYTSAVLFLVWRSTYFSRRGTNTILHVCCGISSLKVHRFLGLRNKHHNIRLLWYFWSEGPQISRDEEHHTTRLLWYFWSEGPQISRDEEQTSYHTRAVVFPVWRSTDFSGGTNTILHVCCGISGLKVHRFLEKRNKHHTTRLLCYFWSEGPQR